MYNRILVFDMTNHEIYYVFEHEYKKHKHLSKDYVVKQCNQIHSDYYQTILSKMISYEVKTTLNKVLLKEYK